MAKLQPKERWRKVAAPMTWRPEPDDELIGQYAGRTLKNGQYGQYDVITVSVPYEGTFMVSGTMLIQLVDAALLGVGDAIRIVFKGRKIVHNGERTMKLFDLYVGSRAS